LLAPHHGGRHPPPRSQIQSKKAASSLDAVANRGGWFAGGVAGEVLVFDGGDFDVDIDAVKERAGDAVAVALDIGGTAAAFAFWVAEEAAFAGMRYHFAG
jgi:hypothetical protein